MTNREGGVDEKKSDFIEKPPIERFVLLLERVEPVTLEIRVSEQLLAQISEPLN